MQESISSAQWYHVHLCSKKLRSKNVPGFAISSLFFAHDQIQKLDFFLYFIFLSASRAVTNFDVSLLSFCLTSENFVARS